MRIFRTSLAGATLALCLGSSSLFAQTEKPVSAEDQVPAVVPVQIENQKQDDSSKQSDDTPATASGDTKSKTSDAVKPAKAASPDTTEPKTVVPQKTARPKAEAQQPKKPSAAKAKPGKFALTFDDLKFEQDKDEAFDRKLLTSKINGYHGGKVKIRGYIRPNFKQSGITKFIFVRDNKECCFGPQAAIFDNILVRLDEGESTNYTVRPITVEGDFVLKEYFGADGEVWSLYRLYNAKVK